MSSIDWSNYTYSSSTSSESEFNRYLRQEFYEKTRLGDIDSMYNKLKFYARGYMGPGEEEHPPKAIEEPETEEEYLFDPKELDI